MHVVSSRGPHHDQSRRRLPRDSSRSLRGRDQPGAGRAARVCGRLSPRTRQREHADPHESKVEEALWDDRENIDLVYCELAEYVSELGSRLAEAVQAT